jgi:hypothetical protein
MKGVGVEEEEEAPPADTTEKTHGGDMKPGDKS